MSDTTMKTLEWAVFPICVLGFLLAAIQFGLGVRTGDNFRILFDGFLALVNAYNLKGWFDRRENRRRIQQDSRALIALFTAEHQGAYRGCVLATDYNGNEGIGCLECGLVSWNPSDVTNRYCANCHKFHEDPRKNEELK